jgi:hypothetical protein
VGGADDDLFII